MSKRSILVAALYIPMATATGTIQCYKNKVHDFEVVDTSVSPPIITKLGPVVDLSDFPTCKLNIFASTSSTPSKCDNDAIQCVKFFLDGKEVRKEKYPPFALFGDVTGEAVDSKKPPIGVHKLKACTYTSKDCTWGESGCKEMEVDFLDCDRPVPPPTAAPVAAPTPAPVKKCDANEIVGFKVVDASRPTSPIVKPLKSTVRLSDFPNGMLNIFAIGKNNTCGGPPIACVKLTLGKAYQLEKYVPYALFGDQPGGPVYDRKPPVGSNTLKACTYTDEDCTKGKSGCKEVEVDILDCAHPYPPYP
jgi:hypothetical protein